MAHRWDLIAPEAREIFVPVRVDPSGRAGPTRRQAQGPGWRRIGKGQYVPTDVSRARVEQRIVEEAARLPPGAVISGWAALRLHRLNPCDGLDQDMRELPVPVVFPPGAGERPVGIERHRESVPEDQCTVRYGVPCTAPERAVFDAMKWAADERDAAVVGDMAFSARIVRRDEFAAYLERRRGDRWSEVVQDRFALTDERSLSPPEVRMRLIWRLDADLPPVRCNWPVLGPDGRRIGRADLICDELAVVGEYDGAEHRRRARQARDVATEAAYRDTGLECFRIVGTDIKDTELVVRRMRAAVRRATEADRRRLWRLPTDPGPL